MNSADQDFANDVDKKLSEKQWSFYHPYKPYNIQLQLMSEIYATLENGYKVGIFESPTGTGKTLSIICSTMSWLRNHRKKVLLKQQQNDLTEADNKDTNVDAYAADDDDEPDWVKQTYYNNFLNDTKNLIEEYEGHLQELAEEYKDIYDANFGSDGEDDTSDTQQFRNSYEINQAGSVNSSKRRFNNSRGIISKKKKLPVKIEIEDERDFLPDDYTDEQKTENDNKSLQEKNSALNTEIKQMIKSIQNKKEAQDKNNRFEKLFNGDIDGPGEEKITIFFTSRTHSQLSQFSEQLNLTQFPSSVDGMKFHEKVKYLPMGSRKQLCINPRVSKLQNTSLINEACLDLQKKQKQPSGSKNAKDEKQQHNKKCCTYYQNYQDDLRNAGGETTGKVRDLVFSKIQDIEDLNKIGRRFRVCPYYSVRNNSALSEIVSLPYQLILDSEIRQLLNINIKNSVVIIDEAHNLMDTIVAINSVKITIEELELIHSCLKNYFVKFMKKLNSGNRVNLLKLTKIIKNLIDFVQNYESKHQKKIKNGLEINVNELFKDSVGGDLINIYNLEKYLKESKIAYKIENYNSAKKEAGEFQTNSSDQSLPLLFKVIKFLKLITNPSKEGKLFFNIQKSEMKKSANLSSPNIVSLNYMLLNPMEVFREIVEDSKCVLLCGGTMEPVEDFKNFLFPYLEPSKMLTFSCDHIIPKENLTVVPVRFYTPRGLKQQQPFDFSFTNRNNTQMIIELGHSIANIISEVPDGVVVFFPSYKYLSDVLAVWLKDNGGKTWQRINMFKKVFFEPRDSKQVDGLLRDYAEHISITREKRKQQEQQPKDVPRGQTGAILLSVVGGKVSEGINFSNELARGVIMIGLPYPNIFSGEIINKRRYIEESVIAKGGTAQQAKLKSMEFYENLCMKAVNQSVGRSIRNRNDYAAIYLVDQRFGSAKIQNKLSEWVRKRLVKEKNAESLSIVEIQRLTRTFFDHNER